MNFLEIDITKYLPIELPSISNNNSNSIDLFDIEDDINMKLMYNCEYKRMYLNVLMLHLNKFSLSDHTFPSIPYFDTVQKMYHFQNHNMLPYKELNNYILEFKKVYNDENVKYIHTSHPSVLQRGCACGYDMTECPRCIEYYNNYLTRLIPLLLGYMSNYPLLPGFEDYLTIDTSIERLNEYILLFNTTYNDIHPLIIDTSINVESKFVEDNCYSEDEIECDDIDSHDKKEKNYKYQCRKHPRSIRNRTHLLNKSTK